MIAREYGYMLFIIGRIKTGMRRNTTVRPTEQVLRSASLFPSGECRDGGRG